jgi:general secretion pathway protein J
MSTVHKQQGLTLIELLVTMVLLGFVVALMSGAFVQIAQMLRISSEHSNGFSERWTHSRAMQDIVANLVPDPTQEIPLDGKASNLTLTTLALPPHYSGIAQRARIELKSGAYNAGEEATTILHIRAVTDTPLLQDKPAFEIARYKGRLIFVYLDSLGKEYSQWPPAGTTQVDKLPSAVGLRDESRQNALVHIAHYEGIISSKLNNGLEGMFGVTR